MQVAQNAPLRPSMDVFSAGYPQLIQLLPAQIHCGIHLWDTRENSNAWNKKVIPEEGYVCSLIASPCGNWFVSGSSRGVLTLWDLRFGIPVNSWQYSVACPIEKMCIYVPPQNNSLSNTIRPLVYVAAGCNEVSLWNAENGSCHQDSIQVLWRTGSDQSFKFSNR